MEDRALYHAILAAPHDDAPRLVYADWLDDRAATEPDLAARRLRARAELIRVQVALARTGPGGWKRANPRPPELVARERRLLFRIGRRIRREEAALGMESAPFDRGFLRPMRALRPHEFLADFSDTFGPASDRFPIGSPLYTLLPPPTETWNAAPLWDVHLFASTWHNDPDADTGQYGPALDEVGASARMERVGWLKVSFARTPVLNFLRYGRFPNVETLVLNSGPFPEVLQAASANDSFRNLRYVQFGDDIWHWVWTVEEHGRFHEIASAVTRANGTDPAFGAMPAALARIVAGAPPVRPAPVQPAALPRYPNAGPNPPLLDPRGDAAAGRMWLLAFCVAAGGLLRVGCGALSTNAPSDRPADRYPPVRFDTAPGRNQYQIAPEVLDALDQLHRPGAPREGEPGFVGPPRPPK